MTSTVEAEAANKNSLPLNSLIGSHCGTFEQNSSAEMKLSQRELVRFRARERRVERAKEEYEERGQKEKLCESRLLHIHVDYCKD